MNAQELQKKYLTTYHRLKNIGFRNKLFLLLMIFFGTLYLYKYLNREYYIHHWSQDIPHSEIIVLSIAVGIISILTLLLMKSFSFVNTRRVNTYKRIFKKDFIDCVSNEIPEIEEYIYYQKLHPQIFYDSNLFNSKYSDYVGDDWIKGRYDEIYFEMCELHVFNLFKNVFSGIFAKISITNPIDITESIALNKDYITYFEAKHKAEVLASQRQDEIFVAIKMDGDFFEADNPKMIKSVEENILLLKDIIHLSKTITATNLVN